MAYKSIFAALTNVRDVAPELAYAAAMTEAQDAHLEVLCVGIDPTPTMFFEMGSNAVVMHAGIEEAHARAKDIGDCARKFLEPSNVRWDVINSVSVSAGVGRAVAGQARFSDLAVLRLPYGPDHAPEDSLVLEGLLFETDCPIIVVPEESASARPKNIVIGWNQSTEAMHAVRAALPFLRAAQSVHIAIIDPPETGPERSDPGGPLAVYLSRHGIRSDIHVMTRQGLSISQRLAQHVTEMEADMLVMGGYGHSRFREAVLGGATRDMLEHSKVPVFMAH